MAGLHPGTMTRVSLSPNSFSHSSSVSTSTAMLLALRVFEPVAGNRRPHESVFFDTEHEALALETSLAIGLRLVAVIFSSAR